MQFLELIKQTNGVVEFSPNAQFLANGLLHRLVIRDAKTLQLVETYTCLDGIDIIKWSSDSKYILTGMFKRKMIQVWSLEDPTWTCQIDEGSMGFIDVCWSPDGRHVLSTSKFQLRVTVWSLMNKSVMYMKYAKQANPAISFSPDGKHMVLAERRECKDHISLFVCDSWQLVKHFIPDTKDIAGVLWSPSGDVLCLWEAVPENYKVYLYSLDGNCLSSYSAYEGALGIKSIEWSPTSQFLAVGSYDEKVRLLNHITWTPITEYHHTSLISNPETIIYKDIENEPSVVEGYYPRDEGMNAKTTHSYSVEENRPFQIPSLAPDSNKANPKHGVGTLKFSPDGRYVFTISDSMPTAAWIWDLDKLDVTDILLQKKSVKCAVWSPIESRLALCTADGSHIYFWFSGKCTSVKIPYEGPLCIQKLLWHPTGKSVLIVNKENMCLCAMDI